MKILREREREAIRSWKDEMNECTRPFIVRYNYKIKTWTQNNNTKRILFKILFYFGCSAVQFTATHQYCWLYVGQWPCIVYAKFSRFHLKKKKRNRGQLHYTAFEHTQHILYSAVRRSVLNATHTEFSTVICPLHPFILLLYYMCNVCSFIQFITDYYYLLINNNP